MFNRDLPECARNYLTDAYAIVRHDGGKFDEMMQKAAVGYQAAVPLVAAAADGAGHACFGRKYGQQRVGDFSLRQAAQV